MSYTPRDRAEELTASLDRNSGDGSVHVAGNSADRLNFSSQSYAERATTSSAGSADGGGQSYGSGSGHGSPSSTSSYLAQQHRDLRRQQQGGFPSSLAAERRDPRTNRVGGGDGGVYAAEIEYGYERYSHPGAKSGAIAAGGGSYSHVASRGGSGRASGLGTRQRWSYGNHATFRTSEYNDGSGSRAAAAAAESRARCSKTGAETGSSSDLRFGAAGGGMQGAGTRGTDFNGMGNVYPGAERGHATNDTEGWWRGGNRYGREAACAGAEREAVIMTGQGRYLTAQCPESSREAARVMALLNAAAEADEDAAHAGVDNNGSAGTRLAKTSHMASAKSVVGIMAAVTVVLVLLPACLSDVGPPPAELMLVPVVVMLLLLTLVLSPTISSFPARSHPS